MKTLYSRALTVLPAVTLGILGGCGVTDRQLADFATSTVVRVFVQAVTSLLEAGILQGVQGGA